MAQRKLLDGFPAPPRPPRRFGFIGALVALSLAIVAGWAAFEASSAALSLGLLLVSAILFVGAIVLANDRISGVWQTATAVPARVLKPPTGPAESAAWYALSFIPVVGLLVSYLGSSTFRRRNRMVIACLIDGVALRYELEPGRHWKHFADQVDVWLLLPRDEQLEFVQDHAPRGLHAVPVPSAMSESLDSALASDEQAAIARRLEDLFEAERRKAAVAKTPSSAGQ